MAKMGKYKKHIKLGLCASIVMVVAYVLVSFDGLTARADSSLISAIFGPKTAKNLANRSGLQGPQQTSDGLWNDALEASVRQNQASNNQTDTVRVLPAHYRLIAINRDLMTQRLAQTPRESAQTIPSVVTLPLPDGSFGRFAIVEAPIMSPELSAQFPEIKTYLGQGIDDPTASARFDWTANVFHATILAGSDTVYIDPFQQNDTTNYISYYRQDAAGSGHGIKCEVQPDKTTGSMTRTKRAISRKNSFTPAFSNGTQLRALRLAVGATAEFTAGNGGTVNSAMAAIVVAINNTTLIFEREIAVRLVLVPQEATPDIHGRKSAVHKQQQPNHVGSESNGCR